MSLITKLFIILVLIAAMVALGVQLTLFSHRVDFKQKYYSIQDILYKTVMSDKEQIDALGIDLKNAEVLVKEAEKRRDELEIEKNSLDNRLADLQIKYSDILAKHEKLITDLDTVVKQLDVQMKLHTDKEKLIADFRDKLNKANSLRMTAEQQLIYVRSEVDKLAKELSELEMELVRQTKEKQELQRVLEITRQGGIPPDVPTKPIDGKVLLYSAETNAVVINVGQEQGVQMGEKFSVYRQDQFVATAKVAELGKSFSVLTIEIKNLDPKVYDDVSNHLLPGFKSPSISK